MHRLLGINAQILKTQRHRLTTFYDNTFRLMRYSINRRNFLLKITAKTQQKQPHLLNFLIFIFELTSMIIIVPESLAKKTTSIVALPIFHTLI